MPTIDTAKDQGRLFYCRRFVLFPGTWLAVIPCFDQDEITKPATFVDQSPGFIEEPSFCPSL
jgi:hypothetical protein